MDGTALSTRLVGSARRVARAPGVVRVRRALGQVLVPQVGALGDEVRRLDADHDRLSAEVERLAAERDLLLRRVDRLDVELDESRRLNVRLAELTDIVTEVVLPLHDREIDAERLRPAGTEPD